MSTVMKKMDYTHLNRKIGNYWGSLILYSHQEKLVVLQPVIKKKQKMITQIEKRIYEEAKAMWRKVDTYDRFHC